MKKAKSKKKTSEWHAPKSPKGMGDYYGTGVRQKMAISRDILLNEQVTSGNLKKPPKTLA